MLSHLFARRHGALQRILAAIGLLSLAAACDKVPLLAPTGSVITIIATSTTVAVNGETEIIATVIEQGTTSTGTGTSATTTPAAGTPVQNGTLVSFTTTLGRIEPREARTNNGEVRVKFVAGGESGEAKITAYSGGATATLDKILIGAAAADHLTVTANPQSLPASGGQAEVIARLETITGGGIAGIPVTFTTTAGTLSPTLATTDANGVARTTLTSDRQAEVTATAGAKNSKVTIGVNPRLLASFTASPQATTAGTPITFTVTAGTNANVRDAVIDFDDGEVRPLGSFSGTATASHAYSAPGSYTPTVTARDTLGNSQALTTTVTVGALPVTLSASPSSPTVNQPVTFTVSGIGSAQVLRYEWTFDDGRSFSTGGPQTTQTFTQKGQKTVRVDVIGLDGRQLGSQEIRLVVS